MTRNPASIQHPDTHFAILWDESAITLIDCGVESEIRLTSSAMPNTGMEDDGKTAVVALQGATFNIKPWSFLFTGKDVVISTDYDEAGRKAAQNIKGALSGSARTIKYLRLDKEGKQNV
jgi:Toprim-like